MPVRLDTWKSISQHMGKSARTLQRWHRVYGLPVHHLAGSAGSVYAYGDELDSWMRGRRFSDPADLNTIHGAAEPTQGFGTLLRRGQSYPADLIPERARGRAAQLLALAGRMWDSLTPRNLNSIVLHYREAVDLNPESAEAYAGLAFGLIAQGVWRLVQPPGAYIAAQAALGHALAMNADVPLARTADAWLKMLHFRDWTGARNGFDEMLRQRPADARCMEGRALLYIAEGRLEKAAKLLLGATEVSPLSAPAAGFYAWNIYLDRKYRHVMEQVKDTRASGRLDPVSDAAEALARIQHFGPAASLGRLEELATGAPENEVLCGALGYANAVVGSSERARELLGPLLDAPMDRMGRDPYAVALVWIGLNEKLKAFKCLKESYKSGSLWSLGFRSDPMLEPLRSDPEYAEMLDELNYPEAARQAEK